LTGEKSLRMDETLVIRADRMVRSSH
jgi:hypothetical protein